MKPVRIVIALLAGIATVRAAEPILIADFEGGTYGAWKAEGDAFGPGPVHGKIKGQMSVTGFLGKGLVDSFNGGDGAMGRLTSPSFKIERKFITFLIGGGGWANETCMNLIVDDKVVRTATGTNTMPGGAETLEPSGWDVSELAGKDAVIQIVDQRKGGWGHINVDHIVQSDTKARLVEPRVSLEKVLAVNGSHLIVPVSNVTQGPGSMVTIGIVDGNKLIQSFTVSLPQGNAPSWRAAYPIEPFGLRGRQVKIATVDGQKAPESCRAAFERISIGSASEVLTSHDYVKPYRNQFHASTRRGWNNDPNGMVFSEGKYHLYYQYNPFGINWGNMHWGHFESTDLVHWDEKPIALYQKTTRDMAFSGGGFLDVNDTSGMGRGTQFAAFTSTGRGQCLVYSKDGGNTFTELPENPVVKNKGRDPKIIWFKPEQKWVMAVFDDDASAETVATPPMTGTPADRINGKIAFYESKDLHHWTRTGAFTDADRMAVYECPEIFELPVVGKPGETRWILLAAQNRYFIGSFDGKTFHKEAGPFGTRHGAFYAAQTFSDSPDGRRIEIGWVQTENYQHQYPTEIVNQAFTMPHEMTLHETKDGLRIFYSPVHEMEQLRGEVLGEGKNLTGAQANELLQKCNGELTEIVIEFVEPGAKPLIVSGMDASFDGMSARIYTDRTINEVYANDGLTYELRKLPPKSINSRETKLTAAESSMVRSLKIFRLKSIWPEPVEEVLLFEDGKTAPLEEGLEFHHGSWKFGDGAMIGEQVPTEKHLATIKGLIAFDRLKIEWKMKFMQPKENFLFVTWPSDSGAHAMDFTFTPDDGNFAVVRPKSKDKVSAVLARGQVKKLGTEWHDIVCVHQGPVFSVSIDGETITGTDASFARPMGPFYLNGGGFDGAKFQVKDLKVTALK